MDKLKQLVAEYGKVAVVTYFSIYLLVIAGGFTAVWMGFQPESAAGAGGTFAAVWVITRISLPFRIAATAIMTPFLAGIWRGVVGHPEAAIESDDVAKDADDPEKIPAEA